MLPRRSPFWPYPLGTVRNPSHFAPSLRACKIALRFLSAFYTMTVTAKDTLPRKIAIQIAI
eukprot:964124-Prymnesium_polylepis.1